MISELKQGQVSWKSAKDIQTQMVRRGNGWLHMTQGEDRKSFYNSEEWAEPDRKLRKKKKKKKSNKRATDGAKDEYELFMAKAYGGISQSQYNKIVALKQP